MAARIHDLSPGLTYWTERHPSWKPNPEWPEEVGCVLYHATAALILIDPLVRDDLDPAAWDWLDERVAQADVPVAVLLTAPWHLRSTRDVVNRYSAAVWVHPSGRERAGELPLLQALPDGVDVFEPGGLDEGEVALFIQPERTLVVAEFFMGTSNGLRVLASPAMRDRAAFTESLRDLSQWPVERVLVAHGRPILENGTDAIAAALHSYTAT